MRGGGRVRHALLLAFMNCLKIARFGEASNGFPLPSEAGGRRNRVLMMRSWRQGTGADPAWLEQSYQYQGSGSSSLKLLDLLHAATRMREPCKFALPSNTRSETEQEPQAFRVLEALVP